jgi:hypothetical protein
LSQRWKRGEDAKKWNEPQSESERLHVLADPIWHKG